MTDRLLITGVSGMLGNNLARYFRDRCEVRGLYGANPVTIENVSMAPVDLLSGEDVWKALDDFAPDAVIHCASLTDINYCEEHEAETRRVNIGGTAAVAGAMVAARQNAALVYISSDAVYDGVAGHFSEDAPIAPQNIYGRSKYEAELAAMTYANTVALRVNIFGWNIRDKSGLGEWMLKELARQKSFPGFTDGIFSSIYTMKLAAVIEQVLDRGLRGVFNCGSRTSMSKYDFAVALARRVGADASLIRPEPMPQDGSRAPRSKNLSMDVTKLSDALDKPLPTIEECLDAFCRDLRDGLPLAIKTENNTGGTMLDVLRGYAHV